MLPIILGSAAFYLGPSAADDKTHQWTIYVRGVNGVDLSSVISKVVFRLHPSCEIPVVEQTAFPFETTQTGWGEFQALVYLHFADASLAQVTLSHHLQLFPDGMSAPSGNKPVVKEVYDEVVFTNVSEEFHAVLNALQSQPCPPNPLSAHWLTFSETPDLQAIAKAHTFVKDELARVKEDIAKLDLDIAKCSQQQMVSGFTRQAAAVAVTGSASVSPAPSVTPVIAAAAAFRADEMDVEDNGD